VVNKDKQEAQAVEGISSIKKRVLRMTHGMLNLLKCLTTKLKTEVLGRCRASYDLRGFWKDQTKESTLSF